MKDVEKEKDNELLFYIESLDPKTNQLISNMFSDLGIMFEKTFSIKTDKKTLLPTPVLECRYGHALRIVMAKEMLNLKFKIWLLNSNGKTLDRRGEFFFKSYLG
ncbi:hypothetical protein KJ991_02380 [Patescibacteria group bacterium]|nr:hypothetical protein [Patescibacteria group bacterium]MBU4057550.1 hypothetical protein [Patescibacteria group bacterium]MBU4115874.1 hypothetical protein [Patescibacteria group bacterium]